MAGPTPVSALIHAATMVTAGVYLVVRSHVLFEISEVALTVVAVVGLAGALYAGFSSLGQYDMKRALAYSTMSQLGFMFLAAGLGFSAVAISLLVAHAFYKALLFLTSGNVMHGLHDEIDVRRLGGLRRDMPWTAALFGAGALALSGLPPFSGFFTKDAILELASHAGDVWAYVLGSLGRSSRPGTSRGSTSAFMGGQRYEGRAHEASPLMRRRSSCSRSARCSPAPGSRSPRGAPATFLEPVVGVVEEGHAGPTTQALIAISIVLTLAASRSPGAVPAEERRALDLVPRSRTRHGRGARSRLLHRRPLRLGRGHRGTARGGGARLVRPHGGRRGRERRRAARRLGGRARADLAVGEGAPLRPVVPGRGAALLLYAAVRV